MGDTIPPRVFDSVSAAVANSQPPEPPPYADVPGEPVKAVKSPRKAAARKTAPAPIEEEPVTGVTVRAGTAGVKAEAKNTK